MLFDEHFSRSSIQRWENSGPGGGGGDDDDNNNNDDNNYDNDDNNNNNNNDDGDDENNNDDDNKNWEFIEAFQWSQVFVRNKKIELAREEKNAEI